MHQYTWRRSTYGLLCGVALLLMCGCASDGRLHPVARGIVTPVTVVRDVVDLPVVAVTNVFEWLADRTRPNLMPGVGLGFGWPGGFGFGVGVDLSWFVFKGLSLGLGSADYLVCRSLYPQWPQGISPWRRDGGSWGGLWFPNTRVLWGDTAPLDSVGSPFTPNQSSQPATPQPVAEPLPAARGIKF